MSVRMKVRCVSNEPTNKDTTDSGNTIRLDAVVDDSPENKEFFRWTPSGQVSLHCVNEKANSQFIVGEEYYVDLSPVKQ